MSRVTQATAGAFCAGGTAILLATALVAGQTLAQVTDPFELLDRIAGKPLAPQMGFDEIVSTIFGFLGSFIGGAILIVIISLSFTFFFRDKRSTFKKCFKITSVLMFLLYVFVSIESDSRNPDGVFLGSPFVFLFNYISYRTSYYFALISITIINGLIGYIFPYFIFPKYLVRMFPAEIRFEGSNYIFSGRFVNFGVRYLKPIISPFFWPNVTSEFPNFTIRLGRLMHWILTGFSLILFFHAVSNGNLTLQETITASSVFLLGRGLRYFLSAE